jgi:hypothetical protein
LVYIYTYGGTFDVDVPPFILFLSVALKKITILVIIITFGNSVAFFVKKRGECSMEERKSHGGMEIT